MSRYRSIRSWSVPVPSITINVRGADGAAQADQRLHKLEVALADLRLEHISTREAPVASLDDVTSLANRLSAVERLHSAVLTSDDVVSLESRMGAVERLQRSTLSADDLAPSKPLGAVERLQSSAIPELVISGPTPEEVAQLNRRLAAMETRQAEALEALRADIVRFCQRQRSPPVLDRAHRGRLQPRGRVRWPAPSR